MKALELFIFKSGRSLVPRLLPFCYLLFALSALSRADNNESYYIGEAFDFFVSDGDTDAIRTMSNRILDNHFDDFNLATKLFDYALRKKDRKLLISYMGTLMKKNRCATLGSVASSAKTPCYKLQKLWSENLSTVNFFEDTAVKLQKAQKLIRESNCAEPLPVLKEVEAKEGALEPLLEVYRDAYICLKDLEAAKAMNLRIERLRILEVE